MVGARAWPYDPTEANNFDGHRQIADIVANRLRWSQISYPPAKTFLTSVTYNLRRSYLPAVLPPGAPGFTGFSLRDLRSIAKSSREPSIYAIQD
ncbi:hypothetical protein INS49_005346 [Diaporthe citri]|uniref:uncharacterized protein n=1 Tax=Diaporthe citri TaxID=83186 RepID=UPI001C826273|nr:uncharacterized protein INS49_005346 [Diaporthe citri]KAG6353638.1 hypothetical protein INS49_005346 [Diaporthe citri]